MNLRMGSSRNDLRAASARKATTSGLLMQRWPRARVPSLLRANHVGWVSAVIPAARIGPIIEPSLALL